MHFSIGLRNEKEAVSDQVSIVYIYIFAMVYTIRKEETGVLRRKRKRSNSERAAGDLFVTTGWAAFLLQWPGKED